jgi:hypothetical protein
VDKEGTLFVTCKRLRPPREGGVRGRQCVLQEGSIPVGNDLRAEYSVRTLRIVDRKGTGAIWFWIFLILSAFGHSCEKGGSVYQSMPVVP